MVYSRSVTTRSFVKALALCAIGLSLVPAAHAKDKSTKDVCSISDGDKEFGIQVVDDAKCANGGLGCYNNHCRFCKVLDTPKSSHLDTCLSHGVAFTSVVPVAVTTGPCEVSSGDVNAGISAVTDSGCLYGGLGCFNDHCRFCKVRETPQSTGFMACSALDSSYSTPAPTTSAPTTSAPATTAPVTDAPATTEPVVDVPTTTVPTATVPVDVVTTAPVVTTDGSVAKGGCEVVPTEGDLAVGITIVSDASCASGGLGCLSDVCRFCKLWTTPQSDPYMDCALIEDSASAGTDTATPDTPATTTAPDVTTDSPVVDPTATSATPDSTTNAVTDEPASTTTAPDATTDSPSVTTATPDSTTSAVTTDLPTATTATGATTDSPVVEPTATTATPDSTAVTDVPSSTTTVPDVPVSTTATSEVPVSTTVASDATSTSSSVDFAESDDSSVDSDTDASDADELDGSAEIKTCSLIASAGDAEAGLSVATDTSCSAGGIGCIDDICRFCKITTSIKSAPYVDCASVEDGSPKSAAPATSTTVPVDLPTEAPDASTSAASDASTVSDAPVVTTSAVDTPSVTGSVDAQTSGSEVSATEAPVVTGTVAGQETCGITAAAGDIAVGVHIATDVACSAGGIGCINDVCRFCKVEETEKSAAFVKCSVIPGFTLEAPSNAATTIAPVAPTFCDLSVTEGDAAVGIRIVNDSTCTVGGIGCINDVCRFCKTVTSVQSAAFLDCESIEDYVPEAPAPTTAVVNTDAPVSKSTCTLTASEGDIAVGVSIAEDTTCSAGGIGCINTACRFCQVTNTTQSAAFLKCSTLAGYTPRSETPVDTATTVVTTEAPVASCDLVVSAGDAANGISITGDVSCLAGGVGCISNVCRFCKVKTTVQSAAFVDCTSIDGFVSVSVAPTVSAAPATVDTTAASCDLVVSEGDAAVGINLTGDSTCRYGGVGCINDVCRYCKVKTTDQSAAFVDCPKTTTTAASVSTDDDTDGEFDGSDSESTLDDSEDN